MCKPMTDDRLEDFVEMLRQPMRSCITMPYRYGTELVDEIRRLCAEAIVWHPWPGEKPERERYYLISVKDQLDIALESWTAGKWDTYYDDLITAWAELPAPYKGE